MVKNHRSDKAVSEVISYVLTFAITSVVVVSTILTTNAVVDSRAKVAAGLQAQIIANQVADGLLSTVLLKQEFPDANYSTTIDIPYQLASSSLNGLGRPYYIEASGTRVYVNSTDGQIIENSTSYNIEELCSGISGTAYSGSGKLKFECLKNDFLYKFDFGMDFVPTEPGYNKVSNECSNTNPSWLSSSIDTGTEIVDLPNYKYRTKISVTNPTSNILSDYPVLVQLNPTNFDYNLAKSDGSDLLFVNWSHNKILPYWIETWNPRETSASRVWVKFDYLGIPTDIKNGFDFYMYYGSDDSESLPDWCNNGEYTFTFFDNFTGSDLDSSSWTTYPTNGVGISVADGCLNLTGVSAVRSKTLQLYSSSPYVVEAKVRAIGELDREASMFVGNDGTDPPYNNGYMLSSGNGIFDKKFAILKDGDVKDSKNVPMGENSWNRLTYTANDTTSFICRYDYTYFTLDSSTVGDAFIVYDEGSSINGFFGLCNTFSDAVSYCDWIFVHPYSVNSSGVGGMSLIPIAYVGASSSKNYSWDDISKVKSSRNTNTMVTNIGTDFVYCYDKPTNQEVTFNIEGVNPGKQYMIIFSMVGYFDDTPDDTVVGSNKIIENVKVTVSDGVSNIGKLNSLMVEAGSHEKFWLLVTPTTKSLAITFSDSDSGDSYYWNVCMLTIERGGMKIKIANG